MSNKPNITYVLSISWLPLAEPWRITVTIAAGGLSGGVASSMADGDFLDGVCNGLISSGLNHAMHLVAEGGVFAKGCLALGISPTEPIPEELQNDAFLKKAQEEWYPDAPMDKVKEFTVEKVSETTQANMDAIQAPAQTNGMYGKNSDVFTGFSKMYFNKNFCFRNAFELFKTMGHEFVHVSQYAYLGQIGYTHTEFMKKNVLSTMDNWAYNYELYLCGNQILHGLSSSVPLFNELDYINFKWHSNHNF